MRALNLVRDSWHVEDNWLVNVDSFLEKAKVWNRDVFDDILKRKNRLLNRLEGINSKLQMGGNPFLERL